MGIRSKITWGITGLFGLAAVPVINDFATKWAEEQRLTTDPSKKVSWVIEHLSPVVHSWWFAVVLGALGGATVALWLSRLWLRPAPQTGQRRATGDTSDLMKIYKANYINETVDIDGKEFIDCTFERTTMRYMGGDFKIGPCVFIGGMTLLSDDPAIEGAMSLMGAMNLSRVEIDGRGIKRFINQIAVPIDHPAAIQVPISPVGPLLIPSQPSTEQAKQPQTSR